MAAHPLPAHAASGDQVVQKLPKVRVCATTPALCHGFDEILAVAPERDIASGRRGLEAFDRREQLHAVVRRALVGAIEGALLAIFDEDGGPTAGAAWIGVASAVRVDLD